ncbi:MAG: tRNA (adenosine(37)-N6)-dimethylallyltransferase MiaA [Clostridiales bacterium]|nr:tRNA (adenosine(37)-N6)-dimethylallyltransferase MiaA [Clostridiales bacterium]
MDKKLIVVLGPTATGKTALSLELASALDGEIISGDSMQVYRGMDIGTAKIRPGQARINGKEIPHHLIDILDPDQEYSVAHFKLMAEALIREINDRGKTPVITGGTGLYINSLCGGYLFLPDSGKAKDFREEKERELAASGTEELHKQLREIDAEAARRIHPHDTYRVIRALEVHHLTGQTMTAIRERGQSLPPVSGGVLLCGLIMERDMLYQRINERVEGMMKEGFVEEVEGLLARGWRRELRSMRALGYRHIAAFLAGEMTKAQAVEEMKRDTRHFAKRQLTWFLRDKRIKWFDAGKHSTLRDLKEAVLKEARDVLWEE